MSITIEAAPEIEETIIQEAAREGVTPQEYVLQAAIEKARAATSGRGTAISVKPGPSIDVSTLALFAKWEAEDPVTSAEDLAERQREGDAITAAIQSNRFNIARDPEFVAIVEGMSREDAEQETGEAA